MMMMRVSMSLTMSQWIYDPHDDDDGDDDEDLPLAPSELEDPLLQAQREDCWASIRSHSVAPFELVVLRSPSQEGGSVRQTNEWNATSLTTSSWRVGPVPTPTTLSPANSSFGS